MLAGVHWESWFEPGEFLNVEVNHEHFNLIYN